jgi:hypothetical protein
MAKITLKGTLSYPYLNAPDTKFNADGEFKSAIICKLSVGKHGKLAEYLEKLLADFMAEQKKETGKKLRQHPDGLPFEIDEDEGTITFKVKNKVYENKKEKHKWSHPIAFFDKDNSPLGVVKIDKDELIASDTIPNVGGGTKAVISVEPRPWAVSGKAGIGLRPLAVKLIEVVEGGTPQDAGDFGFEEDDDDFDAPSVSTSAPEGVDDEDDDEDF